MSTYARFSRFLRRKVFVSFAILLIGFSSGPAAALDFYWDADATSAGNNLDGTGLGGAGTWDTSLLNWWDGTSMVAWPSTNADKSERAVCEQSYECVDCESGFFSCIPSSFIPA